MRLSQYLLLQTASEDALFRLKHSKFVDNEVNYFMRLYYQGQEHKSVIDFLNYSLSQEQSKSQEGLFMQVGKLLTCSLLFYSLNKINVNYTLNFHSTTESIVII